MFDYDIYADSEDSITKDDPDAPIYVHDCTLNFVCSIIQYHAKVGKKLLSEMFLLCSVRVQGLPCKLALLIV